MRKESVPSQSLNGQQTVLGAAIQPTEEEIRKRRMRFAAPSTPSPLPTHHKPSEPIVGRCTKLEKAYFRLTTEPNENEIRPEEVLKRALERLKGIWKETRDAEYVLDQLKAIRQDLVVQGIANAFAVQVYEYNVKIALKAHNLNEFNQCQSMLSSLYTTVDSRKKVQFLAYHILYDLITNQTLDMHRHIQRAQQHLSDPCIHHALLVVEALRTSNYPYFMVLYEAAPKKTKDLMWFLFPVIHKRLLKLYLSATLPSIPVSCLAGLLHVTDEELKRMLLEHGIVYEDSVEIAKNRLAIMKLPY